MSTRNQSLTVEAMAAGTLKMIFMIEFRFMNMNTVASKLAKKLSDN